jgi:branched-chain amino acid transport system ATP-binding protein
MTITIRGLDAGYVPGVNILNGIDADLHEGEVVTVIGPNGSGKSTLLKAVMGYLDFSSGSIEVDEEPIAGMGVHKRAIEHRIAYVPQVDNVFRPLTVRENLEVGGQHISRARRKERIAELMESYPLLAKKAKARADSLSGGERQILAVGRALMTKPKHLLLDEQNAEQALEISDRAYVLVLGRVVMAGKASEVLNNEEIRHLYLGGVPETDDVVAGNGLADRKEASDADI